MPCDIGYTGRIPSAVKLAKEADVTLLVIGDMSTLSTNKGFTPYVITQAICSHLKHADSV